LYFGTLNVRIKRLFCREQFKIFYIIMRKHLQTVFIFLLCLMTCVALYSQSKAEFYSPIVDVLNTDFGASGGDVEINYATRIKKSGTAHSFNHALEIEFTPIKGFGIEVALLNQPYWDDKLLPKNDYWEITGQYSRVFRENFAFAVGVEFEKAISVRALPNSSYGFRPFVRGAAIVKEKIHLQGSLSTEIEVEGDETEVIPRYATAAFYQWTHLGCGLEVIGFVGKEKNISITPQIAFSSGRVTIASGIQVPILFEESVSPTNNARLSLDNELMKKPCFILRLTLSFEQEN
jgi:hypothetical protein